MHRYIAGEVVGSRWPDTLPQFAFALVIEEGTTVSRRIFRGLMIGSLLPLLLTTAVSADTGEPTDPYDRSVGTASFLWTDPSTSMEYDATLTFTRDNLAGHNTAEFDFGYYDSEFVCDPGTPEDPDDDVAGAQVFFHGTAEGAGVTFAIGPMLPSAAGNAIVSGATVVRDECGNEMEIGDTRTFEVSIDLVATSALQRGTGRTVARPPDSPVTIIRIYKTEVRDAAGGVTVDGTSADATWANLYRQRLDIYGP